MRAALASAMFLLVTACYITKDEADARFSEFQDSGGGPDSHSGQDSDSAQQDDDDQDGDGYDSTAAGGTDCDDTDADIHPDADEDPCDGIDQDCDPATPLDDDPQIVTGDGGDASAIQEAMEASEDGGVVCVSAGTWTGQIAFDDRGIEVVGMGGSDGTTLDGDGVGPVVTFDEGDSGALRGFTITGGEQLGCTSGTRPSGGGIYSYIADLALSSLVIEGNKACNGGGAYIVAQGGSGGTLDVSLENVVFEDNEASVGGGLEVIGGEPRLSRVWFTGNVASAQDSDTNAQGGGAYFYYSTASLTDVHFTENEAYPDGGGAYLQGDGDHDYVLSMDGVSFYGNEALDGSGGTGSGGAFAVSNNYTVSGRNVDLRGNISTLGGAIIVTQESQVGLKNAILAGNVSLAPYTNTGGGAIAATTGSELSLENVTLVGNRADVAAGSAAFLNGATMSAHNTTFDANTAYMGTGSAVVVQDYTGTDGTTYTASFEATYSHAYGNTPDDPDLGDDPSNLGSVDPLFVDITDDDPLNWDLSLRDGSPLIDAGDPDLLDADGSASDIGAYGGPGLSSALP